MSAFITPGSTLKPSLVYYSYPRVRHEIHTVAWDQERWWNSVLLSRCLGIVPQGQSPADDPGVCLTGLADNAEPVPHGTFTDTQYCVWYTCSGECEKVPLTSVVSTWRGLRLSRCGEQQLSHGMYVCDYCRCPRGPENAITFCNPGRAILVLKQRGYEFGCAVGWARRWRRLN